MVVSVYVQGKNDEALTSAMDLLRDLIDRFRDGTGNRTDVVLAGDFNRHDLLWGGDEVSTNRQGDGQPIIDLMNEFGLSGLLPRGTKTWQRADEENTIDLSTGQTTERSRRPSTFKYRREAQRRAGQSRPDLEQRAKDAAKEYHDNVRKQKKSHWDNFVTDENNIWKVAKYLKPGADMFDDKVPPLRRADSSITRGKAEQGEELLSTFFPPLPTMIERECERPQREAVTMPNLTLQEIEEKVMAAKSWKAPGEDGLPAIVWKKL
ncbi:hypothetical protein HIM_10859 [Hirsutella minnesotensis 3608]|uniref:Endonuclease/exonuclease/phosphatase domain-containing protein n=1 Tax=Hirsutella minnesotensis 3608 TaxID=1043627 RepID=A0A0F7ZRK0_9HYPO|nr:hypothetical protein HIM_10859 [Hirsutella minnesotensis 3608]